MFPVVLFTGASANFPLHPNPDADKIAIAPYSVVFIMCTSILLLLLVATNVLVFIVSFNPIVCPLVSISLILCIQLAPVAVFPLLCVVEFACKAALLAFPLMVNIPSSNVLVTKICFNFLVFFFIFSSFLSTLSIFILILRYLIFRLSQFVIEVKNYFLVLYN